MLHRFNNQTNEVEQCTENGKRGADGLCCFIALAQPFRIWTIALRRALVGHLDGYRLLATPCFTTFIS